MKNKLHHFLYSVMVRFLILMNILIVLLRICFRADVDRFVECQTVTQGERRIIYVEVTAKAKSGPFPAGQGGALQ